MAPLFTLPIPPLNAHVGGNIVCTEPAPAVYLLTFTSPPDNRLTTAFCNALLDALDLLEFGGYTPGAVVTTSGTPKFYSNGLDLEHALSIETFLPRVLYKLFNRFLTYPMPTVALLNGHAFAGGLMLAMHHDYRVMNAARGFACINELEFGVPLKPAMSAVFRLKLPAATYRTLVLEAHRFDGVAAVAGGIADAVGGLDEVLALVAQRKLTTKAKTGVYGFLKAEMYRESVELLSEEGHLREEKRAKDGMDAEEGRRWVADERLKEIKGRAKL
ncbi:ClpP/crotonase-like domain-containing protein [Lasiosphaeris hirsuta]|uniref:ClpP/crotonase-like domain-containing protein n=1 Tax=Lasiosphaeris hirsuta TaxID=260670 RepID=A0AA39ZW38_9PEZI|nr:ClpP/crotonase-like domain-containing protein [Lasiosphaeris hirsuta]